MVERVFSLEKEREPGWGREGKRREELKGFLHGKSWMRGGRCRGCEVKIRQGA